MKFQTKSHVNDGVVNSSVINCHTRKHIFPHLVDDIIHNLQTALLHFYLMKLKQEENGK